jgi:hypothetical protein
MRHHVLLTFANGIKESRWKHLVTNDMFYIYSLFLIYSSDFFPYQKRIEISLSDAVIRMCTRYL